MKSLRTLLLFMSFAMATASQAQQLTVATFNIRYDNPRDSGNLWVDRAPVVTSLIRFHDFDVFGVQEALKNQLDDISKTLTYYTRYGKGRDDGKEKGEHSAIFFKTDKYTLLKSGDFWLSQTPDVPSLGWDAKCCNRICSWVLLKDKKSGKEFYFFNAHFDHQGVEARRESGKLMVKKIKEIAGTRPAIFTGDLNGGQNSEWVVTVAQSDVVRDSYKDVKYPYANNASFNAFVGSRGRMEIIDHIFISKQLVATKWGILTDTYHGKYPSDHFPVMAVVEFRK
jgi:endonuclease/exonuclease/phosphatase family metal-dependent hydrolase